jgi:hypothetical protein
MFRTARVGLLDGNLLLLSEIMNGTASSPAAKKSCYDSARLLREFY